VKICKREKSDKKIESKFDNGKKTIKSWNVLSSGVELETFHNGKGKNREKMPKKRNILLLLGFELETFHNGRGG